MVKRVITLFFLLAAPMGGCASHWVLPTADGGNVPSPPSIQGRVAKIEPEQFTVRPEKQADATVLVQFTPATELFTVYGGKVLRSDLAIGQHVRVWFDSPRKPAPNHLPKAAVIMLASLDPNEGWPKFAAQQAAAPDGGYVARRCFETSVSGRRR